MANNDELPNFYDECVEKFGEEKVKEFFDCGCSFKEWRQQAKKYRDRLKRYQDEERMGAILEDQWENVDYHVWEREEYYEFSNSPLEILRDCVLGDRLQRFCGAGVPEGSRRQGGRKPDSCCGALSGGGEPIQHVRLRWQRPERSAVHAEDD